VKHYITLHTVRLSLKTQLSQCWFTPLRLYGTATTIFKQLPPRKVITIVIRRGFYWIIPTYL